MRSWVPYGTQERNNATTQQRNNARTQERSFERSFELASLYILSNSPTTLRNRAYLACAPLRVLRRFLLPQIAPNENVIIIKNNK
jgi:hypothetical protein